jgi:hypothetical protein
MRTWLLNNMGQRHSHHTCCGLTTIAAMLLAARPRQRCRINALALTCGDRCEHWWLRVSWFHAGAASPGYQQPQQLATQYLHSSNVSAADAYVESFQTRQIIEYAPNQHSPWAWLDGAPAQPASLGLRHLPCSRSDRRLHQLRSCCCTANVRAAHSGAACWSPRPPQLTPHSAVRCLVAAARGTQDAPIKSLQLTHPQQPLHQGKPLLAVAEGAAVARKTQSAVSTHS